ncbi:hypothetical protein PMI27_000671 [Pseudomonas sp. GM41(2012)]|jgi:hypothetical protein|nr:hypothetical protein PMI27_000671 [Pseudomonas sp. GM41(2012)]
MLAPVQLEHQRSFAAGQNQKQANTVLRNTMVSAIDDVRRDLVSESLNGCKPSWIKCPLHEFSYVFQQSAFGPVKLQCRHNSPGS